MALKPTIYKFTVDLSDIDRDHYDQLNLTVALHPSETDERMMVRLLAYCINTDEGLEFTKGLSDSDDPDLWQRSLDDRVLKWIEVGEPAVDRIRKATHVSDAVYVYTFNSKSETWWAQNGRDITRLGAKVFRFGWSEICELAAMLQRTMRLSVTITGSSIYVASDAGSVDIALQELDG